MVITWKPHLMEKAIGSGMYQATLALDGLNKESHRVSRKPVDIQNVSDKINEFRSRDVLVHGFIVVGLPGEKRKILSTVWNG
jgi:radical SAM superfamily enzyme